MPAGQERLKDSIYSVRINDWPFMLLRDKNGNEAYERKTEDPAALVAEDIVYDNFTHGYGVKKDLNLPATRGALYDIDGAADAGIDGTAGPLTLGPKFTHTTVEAAKKVHKIVEFNSKAYAAVGLKVYESAGKLWTDATNSKTFDTEVLWLQVFQGKNSIPLLIAFPLNGPLWTFNGTTWQVDSPTVDRTMNLSVVMLTADDGANWTDYSANMGDDLTSTAMPLAAITPGVGTTKYVVFGCTQPFFGVTVVSGVANTTNTTLATYEYYGYNAAGTLGWHALTVTSDTTVTATNRAFGQTGTVEWTRPPYRWLPTVLNEDLQAVVCFFVRFYFAGTPLEGTTLTKITALYAEEGERAGILGENMYVVYNEGQRVKWTESGGRAATFFKTANPLGPGNGQYAAQGVAGVGSVLFIKRTTDLVAPTNSGRIVPYASDLFSSSASTADEGVMGTFMDRLYVSHDYNFLRWSPDEGLRSVGPETLALSDAPSAQTRMTAMQGDRAHALYVWGYSDAAAKGWMYKMGTLRQALNPTTGNLEWIRTPHLAVISYLGARKITAACSYYVGTQPYMVFADSVGVFTTFKLSRGINHLAANSGVEFTTVPSYALLPTQPGSNVAREISLHGASLVARNLDAGTTLSLSTRLPNVATWTYQGVFDHEEAHTDFTLPSPLAGYGVDVRLLFSTDTASEPPILDLFVLRAHQMPRPESYVLNMSIQVDDSATDLEGRPFLTARQVMRRILLLEKERLPVKIERDGIVQLVTFRSRGEVTTKRHGREGPRDVVPMVYASAS